MRRAVRRFYLVFGIAVNMVVLFYYKYSAFAVEAAGIHIRFQLPRTLPLGISFFSFQAVGYLIDIYRGETNPERNPIAFGTFLFLFPQLIAGPILRYSAVCASLHRRRKPSGRELEIGMAWFVFGLGAKVLLANAIGAFSEKMLATPADSLFALLFVLGYSLQIYFDFWGYSMMAIGMGRMLGFSFPANFLHPYSASSVTDFWRRWHITLGAWFRDYIYIPLGGSRKGTVKTIRNLLIVWTLTGIWHGAGWNYLLWGLWLFICITVDKYLLQRFHLVRIRRAWMFVSVCLGWALFASHNLSGFTDVMSRLFSFRLTSASLFWWKENAVLWILCILCCCSAVVERAKKILKSTPALRIVAVATVLVLCIASLAKNTYNPFIYFHF